MLDAFVETQTGPQSKRVSRPPNPSDSGAQAAQRTVFQHTSRHEALPLVGDTTETKQRRIELLEGLAERAVGSARARLLTSAAELQEQLGHDAAARLTYERALAAGAKPIEVARAIGLPDSTMLGRWRKGGKLPTARAEALVRWLNDGDHN